MKIKHLINRIKTLYWFWKMTRHWVDDSKWIIERGDNPYGEKFLEMWNPKEYWGVNKHWHPHIKKNDTKKR